MKYYVIVLCFLVGCITIDNENNQQFKTVSEHGISIDIPNNWNIGNIPGYLIFVSEPAQSKPKVLANFEVQIDSTALTLDQYCEKYEHLIWNSDVFINVNQISKVDTIFKNCEAVKYHFEAVVNGDLIEWITISLSYSGNIYKLATTYPQSQRAQYRNTLNQITNSFNFL